MTKKVVIGLTGGIGSGKSAASSLFADAGIDIIDADEVARLVVKAGSPGLAAIVAHFGKDILADDGTLNRSALRERVFNTPCEKNRLNALLHPLIRQAMMQQIKASTSPYCILSVPLLVEGKLHEMCDRVVVVDCPEEMQLSRAMQRDGSTQTTIENIMASQATRAQRLAVADDVIDNSGSLANLKQQVDTLHRHFITLSR